jgi:hypothetical protein
MRSDLTDITLVVDRSGSMQAIQADAQGGVNAFIEKQAHEPGEALLTLVQFDDQYQFVHKGLPIGDVPNYELVPRGMTALLDAVGRAINETGDRLAKMNEQDRPGLVVFVIMTDGLENSSCEFTKSQVKQMIEKQQDKFNWHFTFLGADQDAFAEARGLGIDGPGGAHFNKAKVRAAYGGTASKVGRMRRQAQAGEPVENKFTDQERRDME